jgi:serine/threonine protein phosphatase 1
LTDNQGVRTLVVGDIHGCQAELLQLLELAGLDPGDRLISVGDAIDRGPASVPVVELLRTRPNTTWLMGNHERKHVRSFRGETAAALSQAITRRQVGQDVYPALVEYLDTLPRYLELPEAVLVHAFFEPGVPLAAQRENVIVGTLSGQAHLRRGYRQPWYELYDSPKPIVVGHHDYLGTGEPLVYRDRVFGIDTGCCNGRRLTGLLLPEFRILSVPSARDYWSEARSEALASRS